MRATSLGLLAFVFLMVEAASEITIARFVDPSLEPELGAPATTSANANDAFAIPIGTSGAETTYLLNLKGVTLVETTVNGVPSKTLSEFFSSNTIVASASGFSGKGEGLGGFNLDCHYTANNAGECVAVASDTFTTQTGTVTGAPIALIVPVTDKPPVASPTSSASGVNSSGTSGSGGGDAGSRSLASTTSIRNESSGSGREDGKNSAMQTNPGIMLIIAAIGSTVPFKLIPSDQDIRAKKICTTQAALVYSVPTLTALTTLFLLIHSWYNVHFGLSKPPLESHRRVMGFFLVTPFAAWALMLMGFLWYGLKHPSLASNFGLMYCIFSDVIP
ncbi:hypothetical protein V5O48_005847 [Marasmius crinis-equi]|uniref:Uncharacterized protein n=1 Tax=Marasmius crinis-equi TaxID=585013 RepID=A0ABR3FL59_9AGAR